MSKITISELIIDKVGDNFYVNPKFTLYAENSQTMFDIDIIKLQEFFEGGEGNSSHGISEMLYKEIKHFFTKKEKERKYLFLRIELSKLGAGNGLDSFICYEVNHIEEI